MRSASKNIFGKSGGSANKRSESSCPYNVGEGSLQGERGKGKGSESPEKRPKLRREDGFIKIL